MPPPMPNPSKRMTANPARPVARYRPGKAVAEASSSEEEDSGQEQEEAEKRPPPKRQAPPKASSFPAGRVQQQLRPEDQSEDEEGFVTEEEEEEKARNGVQNSAASRPFRKGGAVSSTKGASTAVRITTETQIKGDTGARDFKSSSVGDDDEDEDDDEDDDEDEDEDEASSSEEEAPTRNFRRPTFIKKSDRGQGTRSNPHELSTKTAHGVISTASDPDIAAGEEARRKELANLLIKEKLERDAAARAAGRKGWDDDDEVAPEDMVDDTDGLDPEAEYAAWKLRELKRLKRDRGTMEQREREIEEVERRRNLTQAEREAEDRGYLERQKQEREEEKGKAGFLQRYHHRGAFFQDDETAEVLKKRDLMGAKFVDEVKNREALPKYMQVRDMTKLGKKGRTRYTDLKGEDTGRWGQGYDDRERNGPKMVFDVDERFRPDLHGGGGGVKGPTGANASTIRDKVAPHAGSVPERAPTGPRARRDVETSDNWHDQGDFYRPRRRSREESHDRDKGREQRSISSVRRQRSLSRSKSPGENRYNNSYSGENGNIGRKKRSISPHRERGKRQRVAAT